MSIFEIIGLVAAIATLVGAIIRFKKWIFPSYLKSANSGLPFWDVAIQHISEGNNTITVARFAVVAENKCEARDRAGQLIRQWNQIRLGFAWPLDQSLPNDDENNPVKIVRPECLPQDDGQSVSLEVCLSKREFILKKWFKYPCSIFINV